MKYISKTIHLAALLFVGVLISSNTNAQTFLTNWLIAFYPFNQNANDASGNGHNGIVIGGAVLAADRFGNPNQAYHFDGTNNSDTNSLINLSQNRPFTGVQTTFSISGWINPRYIPSGDGSQAVSQSVYPGRGIYFHRADWADIGVRINTSPWVSTSMRTLEFCTISGVGSGNHSDNLFASIQIPTNSWTAFVATYDGLTKKIYINGTLNVSISYTFPSNWGTGFIGEGIGGNFAGQAETFDGVIDDIRIYNRALSANEVQQLYASESQPIVGLIKAVKPSFSQLTIGTNYQLQVSTDLVNWTNSGSTFTATNSSMVSTQYFDVPNWNQLFFRLH
jgi:hypothetical protein